MVVNLEEQKAEFSRQIFFKWAIKLFGKYPYSEKVKDVNLSDLTTINSSHSKIIVTHTSVRYQIKKIR